MNGISQNLLAHKDLWPFYLGAVLSVILVGIAMLTPASAGLWAASFYPLLLGSLVCIVVRHRALYREMERVDKTLQDLNQNAAKRRAGPEREAAHHTLYAAKMEDLKEDATPTAHFARAEVAAGAPEPTPRYPMPQVTQALDEVQILDVHFPEDDAPESAPTTPMSATWLPVEGTE